MSIEDLEIEREIENIDFEIGDHVVYPHHGAGQVVKKEEKNILGEVREYLTIKILHNDMTVMVPCQNAGKAGLRRVIDEETVKKVLAVLADDVSEMPKNWNRRFKHNRDKIKTGDIYELAEVVRNLAVREQDKGLSTGEKQMYTRAKKILASEMMYALEKTEDEAEAYLDDILSRTSEQLAAAATLGASPAQPPTAPTHDPPAMAASGPAALLVAAGSGERLGAGRPKAFVELAGRPMLEWSLAALRAAGIDRVVVALPDGDAAPAGLRWACAAARRARRPCARRWPGVRRRRASSSTTPPARWSRPTLFTRVLDALGRRRLRDRRGAGDRHDQGGRRRARGRGARSTARGCGRCRRRRRSAARRWSARSTCRTTNWRAPPTTRRWSSAPAAPCASWSRRPANFKVTTPHDLRVAELLLRETRC